MYVKTSRLNTDVIICVFHLWSNLNGSLYNMSNINTVFCFHLVYWLFNIIQTHGPWTPT